MILPLTYTRRGFVGATSTVVATKSLGNGGPVSEKLIPLSSLLASQTRYEPSTRPDTSANAWVGCAGCTVTSTAKRPSGSPGFFAHEHPPSWLTLIPLVEATSVLPSPVTAMGGSSAPK
jgi:hypothetical protein